MLDLISVGTISMDLSFRGKSLPLENEHFKLAIGGKYVVDELYESVGGGGANVALGLRQYGFEVAVLGIVGENSFKEVILNKLHQAGVRTHLCQFHKGYLNVSSIFLTEAGERSIVHYEPPYADLFTDLKDFDALLETRAIYLGNLPDVDISQRTQLLTLTKHNDILTILNLGVKDVRRDQKELEPLIAQTDILIINGHEFADLVKKKYEDLDFRSNVVAEEKILIDKTVIVTDSEKGSFGYTKGRVFHQKAVEVEKIVDTTGAGDGYTAGFITQYLRSKDIEEAMFQGAEQAAKVLAKVGAN